MAANECIAVHRILIYDRGGVNRAAELVDVTSVKWDRRRDEVSEAEVWITGAAACARQAPVLRKIEPKRSELVIYRGDERVWEGPVSRVAWHSDKVEIAARDVVDYLFHRPLSKVWNNTVKGDGVTTVTNRLNNIVNYEMQNTFMFRDQSDRPIVVRGWEQITPPANVLPYFTVHHFPNEARTAALTTPFELSVGEHLDNYARTGGIDYTCVGRSIHIWDTSRYIGQTRVLTEADFYGEIIITAYGADHASVAFVASQDGIVGGAGGTPSSWRFLEKTGAAGNQMLMPPSASTPRRPSIIKAVSSGGWNDALYWMAYQKDGSTQSIHIARSKDGTIWTDTDDADVDAETGDAVTPGNWPSLAFAYDDRLWLFFIGTDGHLYRTRTENGTEFTVKIDIYTPPGSITMASVNARYTASTGYWVVWFVNTQNGTLNWMSSLENELDGIGTQFGAVSTASIPGVTGIIACQIRYHGSRWVGTVTTASGVFIIESKTQLASSGFTATASTVIPTGAVGKHDTLGKATWLHRDDGNMDVWYGGSLLGTSHIFRTTVSGPAPVASDGDPYYGPWTKMYSINDETETSPSAQELASMALRNLHGRNPVPIEVRVPDNSSIRLSAGLTLDVLVPGTLVPLRATLNARQVVQNQKLDHVVVKETADGETIAVTFVPTTKPDEEEEEG